MPPVRVSKHRHTTTTRNDYFAESFIGQIYYRIAKPKWYQEEQDDFDLPEKFRNNNEKKPNTPHRSDSGNDRSSQASTLVGDEDAPQEGERPAFSSLPSTISAHERFLGPVDPELTDKQKLAAKSDKQNDKQQAKDQSSDMEKNKQKDDKDEKQENPNIVTWYSHDDPSNPQNWSLFKKCFVTAEICILTFSIYIGSAIYSPGYESLNREFGVSSVVATLGLTLFVIGYGVGPLFLSAASEIPQVGRNPPYMITLFLFVILQVPSALVTNFAGLMVLRFLAGFVGSPVLATGGASLGDVFSPKTRPYAIGIWGLSAVCGPVLGPLLGGFAIMKEDWRWFAWILLWLDGGCLLLLVFLMPETSSANILTRRAQRLRKLTGNQDLKSQAEIDGEHMKPKDIANMTLIKPFVLSFTEPLCFACNLYIGLVYSILYVWIESFQLVFVEMHGFNLGENGLSYLGLFVGGVLAYIGFCFFNAKVTIPQINEYGGKLPPEKRIQPAMLGAICLPVSIFWFGWTSNPSIHWIVPIIASAPFSAGTFLLFQAVLNTLGDSYPDNAASVYAGNDFFRSTMASVFPLFAPALFNNLGHGVAWGCVLLGCLCLLFVPLPFLIYKYGKTLRMRSKNARHDL